jgi:hypothetical protein
VVKDVGCFPALTGLSAGPNRTEAVVSLPNLILPTCIDTQIPR